MTVQVLCPEGHPCNVAETKIGTTVVCPRCFASFLAEVNGGALMHARREERRPRRARDEDDDEDEDEEEEDDEPPPRKAKARRARDDDDDEDEDEEEDEDDEDEEDEIEWTPRKRQLNVCRIALILMIVCAYLAVAHIVFSGLAFDIGLIWGDWEVIAWFMFWWISIPLMILQVIGYLISLFISFAVPGKAEARAPIISGVVFFGIVIFVTIFTLLVWAGALGFDPDRKSRFLYLLCGIAGLCYAFGLVSLMGYLSKLMVFMRLHLESSQPITSGGFILLCFALRIGLFFATDTLMSLLGGWMCFVISAVDGAICGPAIRFLVVQTFMLLRIMRTIKNYIREA